jgi:DNA-binding LytR/AlgR family response regulator
MDIQLGDGLSFEIFDQVEIVCPVIFATAYDEYALKAFKVNSVDYILKPVDVDELSKALTKYEHIYNQTPTSGRIQNIEQVVQMLSKKYKERFVIKVGEHLRTIDVKNIHYFFSQDKATFCHTQDNRNHILDFTLEQVEELVAPTDFFRVNRKFLINTASIRDMVSYTNSRLKLKLIGNDDAVIVARERVAEFKDWLDR